MLALTVALVALVLGPAAAALGQAPQLTIEAPEGSPTNNPHPQLRGGTDDSLDDVTVVIEAVGGGGSAVLTAAPVGEGWSVSPAQTLSDGEYTAHATQTNGLGEEGQSGSVSFTIDATSPTVTLDQPSSPSNDTKPTFSGASSDNSNVVVRIYNSSHTEVTSASGGGGGSWTAGNESSLSSGTYTAQAEQSDQAGNTGTSNTVAFTIDTSSPTVALNQPASPSNITKPTFTGTASDTKPVVVHIFNAGHTEVTSASTSGTGGSWSAGNEASLPSGSYTAVATQESSLGNPAGQSAQVAFTVDTSSPTVLLNQPASPSNNPIPTFSGTASDKEAVVVEIFNAAHAKVASATASGTPGPWSTSNEASLPSGSYTGVATQASSLGNPAGKSNQVAFTIDMVKPSVTITSSGGEKTISAPTFKGAAGTSAGDLPNVKLNIYEGSLPAGAPVRVAIEPQKGGEWSAAPSAGLENGTYTAQAEQSDTAGNTGQSNAVTFTVKSSGPLPTLTPLPRATNDARPTFGGGVALENGYVILSIYSGPVISSSPFRAPLKATATGKTWSTGPVQTLPDGQYSAIAEEYKTEAEETEKNANPGPSHVSTFTVDTIAPTISATSPANGSATTGGSQVIEGVAGLAPGDASTVTVRLDSGSTIDPSASVQTRIVQLDESGHWRVGFEGLAAGTYTAQAEQADEAGNSGLSQAITFTLAAASAGAPSGPPTAAFTWVPSTPHVGEAVSLLSSSSDPVSPISAFAWDLTGAGSFAAGAAANSTKFATAGDHIVRLRVTAADGLSSVASKTIPVLPATSALMRPFPIVRIASSYTRAGIRLRLLRVQAPSGARISVTCRNRGCPAKSQRRVAAAAAGGVASFTFHKFERSLRAGLVLEVRVYSASQIGKYTRLTVRRGKLPQRVDRCLSPGGSKAIACPQ